MANRFSAVGRYRVAWVSPAQFAPLLLEGGEVHLRCTAGVPFDARRVAQGWTAELIWYVFEHPGWDLVPFEQEIPALAFAWEVADRPPRYQTPAIPGLTRKERRERARRAKRRGRAL